MISLSQNKNIIHFIEWIPTERGPMITQYGKFKIEVEKNDNLFYKILCKINSILNIENPVFSVSIDSDSVHFTETQIDKNFENYDLLRWFEKQSLGENKNISFESFHYAYSSEQNKFMNIHLPSIIKMDLIKFAQDFNSKIKELSIGIFSAESGARALFNVDQFDSYAILKIGNPNQLLFINNGDLISFTNFNINQGNIKIISSYGSYDKTKLLIEDIKTIVNKPNQKISSIDKLYYYQNNGKNIVLKKLLNVKDKNVIAFNPFNKILFEKNKKINDLIGMQYAEISHSFWGIDV